MSGWKCRLLWMKCHMPLTDGAAGSVPELNLGLVMYIILGVATALKLVSRCASNAFTSHLVHGF